MVVVVVVVVVAEAEAEAEAEEEEEEEEEEESEEPDDDEEVCEEGARLSEYPLMVELRTRSGRAGQIDAEVLSVVVGNKNLLVLAV